jgi:hypothetical protein
MLLSRFQIIKIKALRQQSYRAAWLPLLAETEYAAPITNCEPNAEPGGL